VTAVQLALCEPTWADPEPDDEDDDGPWCYHADIAGQGADPYRLATMTTTQLSGSYL